MYRPQIKVLDCTIRDGGLMNDWRFDKSLVKDLFSGLAKAGVDYVELGYRADKKQFSTKDNGPWRFCDEEDLREVAFECDTKVSIMCDVDRTDYNAFLPAKDSLVKLVRVACYVPDIDKAIHLGNHVKSMGYEVSVNIMAVSHALEPDLDEALDQLAETNFEMVYIVDSFGYLYSEQIHYLANKYKSKLPGKEIGIHCHNNQQLAFANTVEAIIKGMNYLDASIYGIGRAAGNCPLELLLGFLKNPKFDVRPVFDLIEKYFIDLKEKLRWGYEIPYAITGILNKHPRAAMAFMKGVHGRTFSEFYEEMLNVDDL
ncbi:MAG TPA: aldolase catalytic domain-containing protein [Candidatus Hydrogenedentes bacterium]|nr:aldolase catalytic domain-containing protein [Candidatus Hydrogenedentota bacterium]